MRHNKKREASILRAGKILKIASVDPDKIVGAWTEDSKVYLYKGEVVTRYKNSNQDGSKSWFEGVALNVHHCEYLEYRPGEYVSGVRLC